MPTLMTYSNELPSDVEQQDDEMSKQSCTLQHKRIRDYRLD
jgi:hypothetical protein